MLFYLQYGEGNSLQRFLRFELRGLRNVVQLYRIGLTLVITILTALTVSTPASGQARPAAPQQLCIQETGGCDSPNDGTHKRVKWNPGHYLKTQGNHAQGNIADYVSSVTNQLAKTEHSSRILGAQVHYSWGVLEPNLGNYDWGPIYTHLNDLSARNKRLILVIDTKCFRSSCPNLAPLELAGEVFLTPKSNSAKIVEIWEKPNMDLFITFWQALGAEFDGNPALEMVLGSESAPSLQGGVPENYSRSSYATQLKRLYVAQRAAFETTNVVANLNFLTNKLSGLMEQAYQVSAGRGMPDVGDSKASLVFRGECSDSDCGVRDYRGLVPHLGIVSAPGLSQPPEALTDTPAEVIAYGILTKITHYSWVSTLSGEDSWDNIIREIERTIPNGHVACPTQYAAGCR